MESDWAAEHLQTIRTLMERTALYRRALAPIMIFVGVVGLVAALAGWKLSIERAAWFIGYWYAVSAVAISGALLLVRRQAWQQAEPFWSPPTRRVAQAMIPPLAAGFLLGVLLAVLDFLSAGGTRPAAGERPLLAWLVLACLPPAWAILYGCAVHAAGFFMSRGMRLFGWLMVLGGCAALFLAALPAGEEMRNRSYIIMGCFFGASHLAYGVYLYFTEARGNEP
jgi:hypothetical protein